MRFPSVLLHTTCLVVFFLAVEFADAVTTTRTTTTTTTTTTTQPQERALREKEKKEYEKKENEQENEKKLSDLTTHAKQYANELRGKVDAEKNNWSDVKAQTLQKNYVESTSRKEHWQTQEFHLKEYCESNPEVCDEKVSQLQAERVTDISTLVDRVRNERHAQTEDRVRSLAHLKEDAQWHLQRMDDLHKEVESIQKKVVNDPLLRAKGEEAEDDIERQMEKAQSDEEEITELLTVKSQPELVTAPMCFLIEDVTVPSGLVVPGTPTAAEQKEKITKSVELTLELSFMELKEPIEVAGSVLVAEKFNENNDDVVDGNVVIDETSSTNALGENSNNNNNNNKKKNKNKNKGEGGKQEDDDERIRRLRRRRGRLLLTVEVGLYCNDVTDVANSDVYGRNRRNLKKRSLLDINLSVSASTTIGEYAPTVLDAKGAVKITDTTTVSVIDCSDPLFV